MEEVVNIALIMGHVYDLSLKLMHEKYSPCVLWFSKMITTLHQ
jgi:hypothetical protein